MLTWSHRGCWPLFVVAGVLDLRTWEIVCEAASATRPKWDDRVYLDLEGVTSVAPAARFAIRAAVGNGAWPARLRLVGVSPPMAALLDSLDGDQSPATKNNHSPPASTAVR